jgi:hypothetical protein
MDNPPPKIVQGYKFNIFYPDMIDKNTTPKYTVVRKDCKLIRNCNSMGGFCSNVKNSLCIILADGMCG